MRTTLTAPPHWTVEDLPDGRRVLRIPGDKGWGPSDISLVLHTLQPLPDPSSAVIAPFVGRDLPPGGQVKIRSSQAGRTTLGAPMVLVEAEVVDAGGRLVEERLAALYEFLEYGGAAMARCESRARLDSQRAEIVGALATGRADFTGHIAAIEQLFVGFPEEG